MPSCRNLLPPSICVVPLAVAGAQGPFSFPSPSVGGSYRVLTLAGPAKWSQVGSLKQMTHGQPHPQGERGGELAH